MTYNNLKAYQQTSAQSAEYADPYTLVGMLMENVIQRVGRARAAMDRKDYETRAQEINKTTSILNVLRGTLDHEQGGEIAGNLEALYDYMQRQLLLGSARKDGEAFDEVARLMRQIKDGWDGIGPEVQAGKVTPGSGQEGPGQEAAGQSRISVTG